MKNTIIETLKGLAFAKENRLANLAEAQGKDNTQLVADYKLALEKELTDKLNAYMDNLEAEKAKGIDKIKGEIATIDELSCEFNEKLNAILASETEAENASNETADTAEGIISIAESTETANIVVETLSYPQ